ncbi:MULTISPECIES: YbjN domain-containing protein [Cyanophyceae]|uniref:YbjN domain-containing protein n=1 Tax=Cyanophyceae TaxID=3028117 RepID=UPI0016828EBA|nr:YbjN domain-containing protein [Trichocoleus sp. FACHB-40]MBD2003761.1 YbjN domain-containing protein [Trichocoleus sp. FACHB-40]
MSEIFEAVINFFKENNWLFFQMEQEPALQMSFQGENGQWMCFVKVREEQEQLIFYSISPVKVPENKRLVMAEFLSRANFGLSIGNFELNFADGQIRYKTSIAAKGNGVNSALIGQLIFANLLTMDEYLPGIMSIIYTELSALEAIAQIES